MAWLLPAREAILTSQPKRRESVCVNVCVSYRKNDRMNESGKKKEHGIQ